MVIFTIGFLACIGWAIYAFTREKHDPTYDPGLSKDSNNSVGAVVYVILLICVVALGAMH
jgi:hypothetical protein